MVAPYRRLSRDKLALLAFPPPVRGWLTLCNDPDNTTIEAWEELHAFIWEELALPFADALFVHSFNDSLPDQVSLARYRARLLRHPYDVLHTWGDYVRSRHKIFARSDARAAMALLAEYGLTPIAWSDHSNFVGNVTHGEAAGAARAVSDRSGHHYENDGYTLDIMAEAGIVYLWDGKLTPYMGQDAPTTGYLRLRDAGFSPVHAAIVAKTRELGAPLWRALDARRMTLHTDNRQYYVRTFEDGRRFYLFRRYGLWQKADIDGVADLLSRSHVDALLARQGTCILYTHLGKRVASRMHDTVHIPARTREALRGVRARMDEGVLRVSPMTSLLDYLVLRDHAVLDAHAGSLDFRADGIRFTRLAASDVARFEYGVFTTPRSRLRSVSVEGVAVPFDLTPIDARHAVLAIRPDAHAEGRPM